LVGRRVALRGDPQAMVEHVAAALEVEVAVGGEVHQGRRIGRRLQLDDEPAPVNPVAAGRLDPSRIPLFTVLGHEPELDPVGSAPSVSTETLRSRLSMTARSTAVAFSVRPNRSTTTARTSIGTETLPVSSIVAMDEIPI